MTSSSLPSSEIPHPSFSTSYTAMVVYCDWCQRSFGDYRAFNQHKDDSSHWACDVCNLYTGSHDSLRQHYIQDSNHHYCKVCDEDFKVEESRRQHIDAKHWYCEQHDQVSTTRHYQIYCRNLFGAVTSRSSSSNMAFIRTIDRAWTTTIAKMSCGVTQLRSTMNVAPARALVSEKMAEKTICIDADAFVSWPSLFPYVFCLCVPNANEERQGSSGRMNGARRRAQRVRRYGTV
jgi:hypothetical protein